MKSGYKSGYKPLKLPGSTGIPRLTGLTLVKKKKKKHSEFFLRILNFFDNLHKNSETFTKRDHCHIPCKYHCKKKKGQ